MKKHLLTLSLIIAALVVLTACSAAPTTPPTATTLPTMAPTETATSTPVPTASATSTVTSTPQPTATPTITLTSTLTATSTSTPRPAFAGFQVEYSEYTKFGLSMTFRIPGIKQNYRLEVAGIPFSCSLQDKFPDRLFCQGSAIEANKQVILRFYALTGGTTPVYETTYKIVPLITPTPDVRVQFSAFKLKCPGEESKIKCETEYRVNGKGCCVVATCYDACGNVFSANSCPERMELQGICPGTPPIP